MVVNVGGDSDALFNPSHKAVVFIDAFTPQHLIWIVNARLSISDLVDCIKIVANPRNKATADTLAELHNEIYNSPLAEAMRE